MALNNAFSLFSSRSGTSSTSDITLNIANPAYSADKALSSFKIKGSQYLRKREIATGKKARDRNSLAWKYGETLIRTSDKVEVFYCYECELKGNCQQLPVLNGTTGARQHLRNKHRLDPDSGELIQKPEKSGNNTEVFTVVQTKEWTTFKQLLLRWFVFCQLALFMLENLYFRELMNYLNKGLASLLPKSSKTLRNWIMEEYVELKKSVADELSWACSNIHITFDIWTAGNFAGYMSIWGYWIDASGSRQRRLLAFRRIYGSHSGENQAEALKEVLEEYSISNKVGYIVCDNASSNDSAVELLLSTLFPTLSKVQIKARRLRCFGHIVNLAAQSLLAGSDAEKKRAKEELELTEGDFEVEAARWIHQGPLGKVQRLVKYVLASPQRREEFSGIKGGRKVEQFDHLGVSVFPQGGVKAGWKF
jgi:hypothetical protein